ncbi:MAG: PadR family transcriptional regulator [Cyanobacteria bacterium P01_H01_bin.119]
MALAHTILAVLSQSPCSGYDIGKRFDADLSCYWKASQQQIYRELSKMETDGWVEFEKIPQAGKPDKKVYKVTPAGFQVLTQWFAEPTEPTPIREDLLVKVMAAAQMPRELLLKELHHRRQLHQTQLGFYRDKECCFQAVDAPSAAERFKYLTLRRGIRYEEDWIAWCDEVLDALKQEQPSRDESAD